MRILLDESLPRRLRTSFPGHEVATVAEAGWSGLENGELLRLAASRFDLFVTADQNLQYQQNLSSLPLSVAVLAAATIGSTRSFHWSRSCWHA
jgi:predicted nuclease of predicted toxin-antitoxin system